MQLALESPEYFKAWRIGKFIQYVPQAIAVDLNAQKPPCGGFCCNGIFVFDTDGASDGARTRDLRRDRPAL